MQDFDDPGEFQVAVRLESSAFATARRPFPPALPHVHKSTRTLFLRDGKTAALSGKGVDANGHVTEGRGRSLIRTAELRRVSERMFCLDADPTCAGHRVCRAAQLVLKSAAARQQGGARQRRLVINHHSCSRLLPALLPLRQKDGREERTAVASTFH